MKLTQRRLASDPEIVESTNPDLPYGKLVGYAAKFGVESEVLYDPEVIKDAKGNPLPFIEVLDLHVFDRTLHELPDVRALHNHDTSAVLGRTKSGTLRIRLDDVGLGFEDDLPGNVDGQRAHTQVKRKDVDGCSFGFVVLEDELVARPGLPHLRTLFDVDLFEISIAVTFPAYTQTEVSVRTKTRGTDPLTTPRLDHFRRRLLVEGL